MKRMFIYLMCAVFVLALCGCGANDNDSTPQTQDGKISIVTTVYPLYDFVRAVAGEFADIKMLIAPGTEVHSYDPSPSDIAAIYDCDLFVFIGGESEQWVDRVLNDVNVNRLKMMGKVKLLNEDGEHGYDEHIWTSPENAISMINAICDSLCDISEDNAEIFKKNSNDYTESIRAVQSDIHTAVRQSENGFILVADRFPFKYFTEEFGIDYKAAFGGCATSTDISLKVMGELTKTVEEKGITAAFYTEMSNRVVADALAEETGIQLYELHSAHNVTTDDFNAGVTYVDIMRRNLESLRKGMK